MKLSGYADVEQRPSSHRGIAHTRLARHRIAQVRRNRPQLADRAGGHDPVDDGPRRHVARPDSLRAQQTAAVGRIEQRTGLRGVRGERLFDQDVLAGLQAGDALLGVQAVRRGDIHQIHVRVGQQLVIRAIRHREPVFGRERRGPAPVTRGDRIRRYQTGIPRVRRHRHQCSSHRMRDAPSAQNRHVDAQPLRFGLGTSAVQSAHHSSSNVPIHVPMEYAGIPAKPAVNAPE